MTWCPVGRKNVTTAVKNHSDQAVQRYGTQILRHYEPARFQLRTEGLQMNIVIKNIEVYNDMHRYIPYLAKIAGFSKIGEKVVKHQARKYGTTKFGLNRFVNGYLDLITLWFTSKFGKKPMHFFGLWGSVMFFIGFIALVIVLSAKLISICTGDLRPLVTNSPYFYVSLTAMILGTQMFLAGFIGELISRDSPNRNKYKIETEL